MSWVGPWAALQLMLLLWKKKKRKIMYTIWQLFMIKAAVCCKFQLNAIHNIIFLLLLRVRTWIPSLCLTSYSTAQPKHSFSSTCAIINYLPACYCMAWMILCWIRQWEAQQTLLGLYFGFHANISDFNKTKQQPKSQPKTRECMSKKKLSPRHIND